jgi:DNA-binding response OmpR family regulator
MGLVQKKILVVDDDPDMVDLLVFTLRRERFLIGTAADGIEAIEKARSLRPDLILLDLLLPELDGFAVCETLRRAPATASIPVIMVTAVSSQFSRLAGLDAGAIDFVQKPFSPKALVHRIKEILGMNAALAAREANRPENTFGH